MTESQEEIKENLWCSHREHQQEEIFFTVRAANDWNSLPDDVTSVETLDVFKAKLDNTWRNLKYEMTMEGEPKQQ